MSNFEKTLDELFKGNEVTAMAYWVLLTAYKSDVHFQSQEDQEQK